MGIEVIKRDGSREEFSTNKVANAIMRAAIEVGGENFDLAGEIAEIIEKLVSENSISSVSTEQIQNIVEKTLIEEGHAATAKEYILKAADRSRIREMNTSLMKSFEEITFKSPEESDTKRENANIDSSTAMGTMLKYGSEGAKKFNLLYLMSNDIAEAHKNGDIHIHDLDFLALTETCIPEDAMVTLRINGKEIRYVQAREFLNDEYFGLDKAETGEYINVKPRQIEILSNGKFVRVTHAVKHSSENKVLLDFVTPTGKLSVTSEHLVTVQRCNNIMDIKAKEVQVGDILCISNNRLTREDGLKKKMYLLRASDDTLKIHNTPKVISKLVETLREENDIAFDFRKDKTALAVDYLSRTIGVTRGSVLRMVLGMTRLTNKLLRTLPEDEQKLASSVAIIEAGDILVKGTLKMTYNLGKFVGYIIGGDYNSVAVRGHEACDIADNGNGAELSMGTAENTKKFIRLANRLLIQHNMKIDDKDVTKIKCCKGFTQLAKMLTNSSNNSGNAVATNTVIPRYVFESNIEFRAGFISAFMDLFGSISSVSDDGITQYQFKFFGNNVDLADATQALLLHNQITSHKEDTSCFINGNPDACYGKGWEPVKRFVYNACGATSLVIDNAEDLSWVMRKTSMNGIDPITGMVALDKTNKNIADKLQSMRNNNLTITGITSRIYGIINWESVDTTLEGSFADKLSDVTEERIKVNRVREDEDQLFGADGFVFDLTTEDNHFDVNGFRVHNCCQIPLDKLYNGGFNTGHGFLREPGSIRTAGALAAIAIQSDQNDQHKRVM